jgi:6-pyruvoyl-tetrahydropterin synthase
MYALTVRDHVMIAHSFRGAMFGPAQALHGATYVVDVEVRAPALDADGVIIDIGVLSRLVGDALAPWRYKNLDELPQFAGQNTTTEFLSHALWQTLAPPLRARGVASLKITLAESHVAWASYDAAL